MSSTYPIPRQYRQIIVLASAGQTTFGPTDFLLYDPADVEVYVKTALSSVFQRLAADQYTVSIAAPAVAYPALFTVTLAAPRAAGDVVKIKGARLGSRVTDVTRGGRILSQPLEREFDLSVITEQELRRDIDDLLSSISVFDPDIVDEVQAAANAALEAAADAEASAAALGNQIRQFDTRALAAAAMLPAPVQALRTVGYHAAGDGGGALYRKLGAAPAPVEAWHFQSADGAWWTLAEVAPNVRMFGAVGDGVADDKLPIRAAIKYARGGTLRFPKGAYFVEELAASEIFLIDQAVHLIGVGGSIEGSWIKVSAATPATCDVFHIKPAQASIPFVEFRGLHISPQVPETYVGFRHAIHIETDAATQLQRFYIADCWINAANGYAVYGEDTDVTFSTAAYYQSVIERNVLFGFGGGIRFTQAGDNLTIADNVFVGGGRAIYISAVAGAAMQVIERNGFQGTPLGAIQLVNCSQVKVAHNQIEQGVAYGGAESGMIVLDNCLDCDLVGNNMNGFNQVVPIRLRSGSARNRIKDNTIAIANNTMRHVVMDVTSGTLNVVGASNTFLVAGTKAEPLVEVGVAPQGGVIAQLAMFNAWVEDTAGYQGLFYRVNEDDTVSLFGNIRSGLATAGANVAQLPVGIRPSKVCYLPAYCAGNTIGLLAIGTDGFVSISVALPNNTAVKVIDARYPLA